MYIYIYIYNYIQIYMYDVNVLNNMPLQINI